ncbi:MAG: hypothetical protein MUF34_13110 [Polyangiaceae bacterium]|nr:hypothetical protein [Polyangiaceae bacterium]
MGPPLGAPPDEAPPNAPPDEAPPNAPPDEAPPNAPPDEAPLDEASPLGTTPPSSHASSAVAGRTRASKKPAISAWVGPAKVRPSRSQWRTPSASRCS